MTGICFKIIQGGVGVGVGGSMDERVIGEFIIVEAGRWMHGSSFYYSPGNTMLAAVPGTITSKRIKRIIFS